MKFVEEKALRDAFWSKYGKRSGILRHQFESPIRHGGMDLLTVEIFDNRVYFVAFEFKLDDIKKALAQAEENLQYVHKSFIVIPQEKCETVIQKYGDWLKEKRFIGVIGVSYETKQWKIEYQPMMRADHLIHGNQDLWKLMVNKIN